MIFSVSDKGGLEEKKFCPMYSPGLLKFAVTFRLLYLHTVSQGAYKHTLTYTKNRQIIIIIIIKKTPDRPHSHKCGSVLSSHLWEGA